MGQLSSTAINKKSLRITNRTSGRFWHSVSLVLAAAMTTSSLSSCRESEQEIAVHEELREVNGTELFVKRMGQGQPILIVHGGPVLEHGYLLPHLTPLAESFELIFFDQRLSGRSAGTVDSSSVALSTFVEDIEALRLSLGLETIHLMGHSWGGLLAMLYAVEYPENLRSLLLLNSMPASSALWQQEEALLATRLTEDDRSEMLTIRESEAFAYNSPEAIADILRASFKVQFYDRTKVSALELFVPDDYTHRSAQFGYLMNDLLDFDFHARLTEVPTPTLILYGSEEPAAELSGVSLDQHFPNSQLAIVEGAGHFPFIEQPEVFLDVVETFLEQAPRDTSSTRGE